jgi:hypothetical protein
VGPARPAVVLAALTLACGDPAAPACPACDAGPGADAASAIDAPPAIDAAAAADAGPDPSDALFDPTVIRTLDLRFTAEVAAALDAEAVQTECGPNARAYHPATLELEGETYAIGLKTKGNCGSSRGLAGKPGWKISTTWDDPAVPGCPAERRILGVKHLTLNAMIQDASFVHEQLAYQLYRGLGVPAPRAAYVRVRVNDEPTGLYLHLETTDRRMLGRWFGSNDGMMYEGTFLCDLVPGNLPPSADHADDLAQCLGREFTTDACDGAPAEGADPTDYGPLRDLVLAIDALPRGGFHEGIGGLVDLDEVLTVWAADAVINHWDDFFFPFLNNYRVYHDPSTDRWSVLPGGTDQTFTTTAGAHGDSAFQVANVIARRCREEPACEAAFAVRLGEVLDAFDAAGLDERALALRDLIADEVAADPRKEHDTQAFLDGVDAVVAFVAGRRAHVEADLAAHGYRGDALP